MTKETTKELPALNKTDRAIVADAVATVLRGTKAVGEAQGSMLAAVRGVAVQADGEAVKFDALMAYGAESIRKAEGIASTVPLTEAQANCPALRSWYQYRGLFRAAMRAEADVSAITTKAELTAAAKPGQKQRKPRPATLPAGVKVPEWATTAAGLLLAGVAAVKDEHKDAALAVLEQATVALAAVVAGKPVRKAPARKAA